MESIRSLFRGKSAWFTVPLALTLAWTVVDVLAVVLGGFVKIDAYWVIGLLAKLAILGLNVFFIKAFFIDGRRDLYGAFRKYAGYGVVLGYTAISLPTMAWQLEGIVEPGLALFFWTFGALQALIMMALWVSLRLKKAQVFWGVITPEEAADKKLLQRNLRSRKRSPFAVIVENLDMAIQTVFIVIVLQQFVFQLYVIPSESMVPTMLEGDRPLIIKTLDGPMVPMSTVKFPELSTIERGQIVVFESPVYQRPPLYIQVFQQFVFFMTLSLVDLDKTEDGKPKVHFVVKRVTGVPGEKLMMIDDKLFVKTVGQPDFTAQAEDAIYSHVDLWKEPESIRSRIKDKPLDEAERRILDRWDQKKNELDPAAANRDLLILGSKIDAALGRLSAANRASLSAALSSGTEAGDAEVFRSSSAVWTANGVLPWQNFGVVYSDAAVLRQMASNPDLRRDFQRFIAGASSLATPSDLSRYQVLARNANLVWKTLLANRYLAILSLAAQNADPTAYEADTAYLASNRDIREFQFWMHFYDSRNFPEYPAGPDAYIPEEKYFLMGDNRYNSLDFRFDAESTGRKNRAVDEFDPHSFVYGSMLKMRLLDRSYIIGHLALRLFPFDRFGLVKP